MTDAKNSLIVDDATAPATIVYLHSSDDLYGADLILLQIVTGLDRTRYAPLVVLPDDMKHVGLLSRELEAAHIEYVHLSIAILRRRYFSITGLFSFAGRMMRGTWEIWRLARKRNVAFVHGFTLAVVGAPAAAIALGVPLVMHAHEIVERPRFLRKVMHALAVRTARKVVCVSTAVQINILRDEPWARDRVVVLRNGIAPFPGSAETPAELKRELGLADDIPLVGMIGRVSPWKGQEIFARAAGILRTQQVKAQFVAVGGVFDNETQHMESLQRLIVSLHLNESLKLVGFRKDARRFLSAFDIFVLPSTSPDPLPTVVLEAMSAGVPVIATSHGGALEMVIDGETGLLVYPGDPEALARAVVSLLHDPLRVREMGMAARRRFAAEFSLDRFLLGIHTIYNEIQA